MDEKNLLEDDIIDLTDLLEEGSPPKKPQPMEPKKKMVTEPDSFDLGKEIAMDYDVSIEEIEQNSTVLAEETPSDLDAKPRVKPKAKDAMTDLLNEPLGNIEAEIDLAMKDKIEEVSLTPKEEEALLKDEPAVETPPAPAIEEGASAPPAEAKVPIAEPVAVEEISIPALEPAPVQGPASGGVEMSLAAAIPVDMPTEAILDSVITEFKKEMPALLEGIVRPVMKELIQEIITSTRESLPAIIEKVIREEIDKLKKL
ncbi:MAG TPA: hypothetical protein VMU10_06750 [Desulfomonilia bacterium]|nr:hypothetical protein [Desulfomonilia bacterium]